MIFDDEVFVLSPQYSTIQNTLYYIFITVVLFLSDMCLTQITTLMIVNLLILRSP